jgi:hypothetical protein
MVTPTSVNLITTAVQNMLTAYTDAAGRPSLILEPRSRKHRWSNTYQACINGDLVTIPSNITISGSADDVWIFQISGD